jgi:hypothetical protein
MAMKTINLLRREVEVIDRCLSDFQQPIPRKVTEVARRQLSHVLGCCPSESRADLAFEIYEVLRRHDIPADVVGLLTAPAEGRPTAMASHHH